MKNNPLRLVIVSGLTSSGQTTVAKAIAEHLNWPMISIGDISREYCKAQGIDFPTTSDLNFHKKIESEIKKIVKNTSAEKPLVLSSRTAAYHAHLFKQNNAATQQPTSQQAQARPWGDDRAPDP